MSAIVFEVPFATQTSINLQDAFSRYRQKKQVRAKTADGKDKAHPKVYRKLCSRSGGWKSWLRSEERNPK